MTTIGPLYMFIGVMCAICAEHVASDGRFAILLLPVACVFISIVNLEDKK